LFHDVWPSWSITFVGTSQQRLNHYAINRAIILLLKVILFANTFRRKREFAGRQAVTGL